MPLHKGPAQLLLMPGQWFFGHGNGMVRTLLGSCVGVALWHPQRRIGALCHYLLPSRPGGARPTPGHDSRDGRYGDEAIALLLESVRACGTLPAEYAAHLYGGADTFADTPGASSDIGARNIETGWTLLEQHGFTVESVDVGENVARTVTLSLADGRIAMQRGDAGRTTGAN